MTPTSEASEAWAQAAKAALPVPFRPDGPPLGFEFDPVPQEKRLAIENLPKSKKMVIGEYDAEAAEDGSIQVGSHGRILMRCFLRRFVKESIFAPRVINGKRLSW